MSYNWGPYYIVPTDVLKSYSGTVVLREEFDEELLRKELESLGITGPIVKITNPWYCRRKGMDTWIRIGESDDEHQNFPTRWDTTSLENGQYEVMGLMHVFVKKNGMEIAVARQNVVEVTVQN
jgi:small-conductance mechanosensitive channel